MESPKFIFDRVMIVDDTKIDRYIVSLILKTNDFAKEVIEFDMASKALDFLENNQDAPDKLPQVILLDIRMPVMDGFEFLERLALLPQSIKQGCCIVMLSSSLHPADHKRVDENPLVKKFINKPLKLENFEEIIDLYKNSDLQTTIQC